MTSLASVDTSEARAGSGAAQAGAQAVLRLNGLGKRYGAHWALRDVNLDIYPGQVHVLFGENGAGKSTLISLLAGANQPSVGSLNMDGFFGDFRSVSHAREHGVRAVFQEFSLAPNLSVADNIVLGDEATFAGGLLDKGAAREEARRLIERLGFDLDARALVADLPRGKQQMVEICKAVRAVPKVLILDEPTASLSTHDTRALFELLGRLKAQGTAIIYITHRMEEIGELGDVVTVLRDGEMIATVPASTEESRLIELMSGRKLSDLYPAPNAALGQTRLKLENLSTQNGMVRNAKLEVREGEIVGIAGLVGCGKSELGQACFGVIERASGQVFLDGQAVDFKHPADAIAAGLWYSPPDRKRDGLALIRPARENMLLSALGFGAIRGRFIKPRAEAGVTSRQSEKVDFPATRLRENVSNFSGGNQQKVMLAKSLGQRIGVYIFDEPTVGVDVGARQSIYRYLSELAASGAAIVLVSSDLPELLGLSNRIAVMRSGVIVAQFERAEFDQHKILEQFFE
jgi:ribose transport system ATP-binding protein